MEDKNEVDDQEETRPKRVIIPLIVLYCQSCGNPPEYCQYAKNITNCLEWRKKNLPELYEKELQIMMQCLKKQEKDNLIQQQEQEKQKLEAEEEQKEQVNPVEKTIIKEGMPQWVIQKQIEEQKQEVKEDNKKESKKKKGAVEKVILIEVSKRKGKKMLTLITGLPLFDISLDQIKKKCGKKFASGTSIVEDTMIEVQGDISDTVVDWLMKEYPQLTAKDFRVVNECKTEKKQ